jgi:hypothetical protein
MMRSAQWAGFTKRWLSLSAIIALGQQLNVIRARAKAKSGTALEPTNDARIVHANEQLLVHSLDNAESVPGQRLYIAFGLRKVSMHIRQGRRIFVLFYLLEGSHGRQ